MLSVLKRCDDTTVDSDSENRSRSRRACNLPGLTVRAPAALYIVPGRRTFLSTSIRPEWPSIAPSVERAGGEGGYAAASLFLFSFNSSGAAETWMSYYFGPADYFSDGYLDGAAQGAMHSHNLGAGCADGQYRLSVCPSVRLSGRYILCQIWGAPRPTLELRFVSLSARVFKDFFSFLRWCLMLKWNVSAGQNHLEK